MCVSISTMRVCLTYIVLGFDGFSSIQEELQGREMASPSSKVEGGHPTLMKTKTRWRQRILYSKINEPGKYKQLSYRIIIITNFVCVLYVYVYICVCLCVYFCVYLYVWVSIYVCMCICMCICMSMFMCIYVLLYVYVCVCI